AGVDQVDLGTERLDALDQQLGVDTGRTREERCAEAGGEGRLDAAAGTHLGGTDQRGVAGQEVVGRLLVVERSEERRVGKESRSRRPPELGSRVPRRRQQPQTNTRRADTSASTREHTTT